MLQTHPARTHGFAHLAGRRAVAFRVQRESARREGKALGLQEPVGRDFGEAHQESRKRNDDMDEKDDQIAHLSIVARTGNARDWSEI